jgi:hypothetical protein
VASDQATATQSCDSWACAFTHVYDNGGVGVIAFFGLAFLFYKLIWKVWRAMLASKDAEIERLTKERNFYQDKLFPGRVTSDIEVTVDASREGSRALPGGSKQQKPRG